MDVDYEFSIKLLQICYVCDYVVGFHLISTIEFIFSLAPHKPTYGFIIVHT